MTRRLRLTLLTCALALLIAPAASAATRLDGELIVENNRFRAATIYLDNVRKGKVAPREALLLRHVPNGLRLLRFDSPGLPARTVEVRVKPRQKANFLIKAELGTAAVRNRSGISMRIALNGRSVGVVANGERLKLGAMQPGHYRVTASPVESFGVKTPTIIRDLHVVAGARAKVRIGAYLGAIEVTNPFHERVSLFVNHRKVAKLGPRATMVLPNQVPGTHAMTLRFKRRVLAEGSLTVPVGATIAWKPQVRVRGKLRVTNVGRRPLRLELDGRRLGKLVPGETRTFVDLPLGLHNLTVSRNNGMVRTRQVNIRRHMIAAVEVGRRPVKATFKGAFGPHPVMTVSLR